ncbi:hypothetical protein [Dinoroseobacter sp. S124A]|uniref:hypothetical protein n=1 Tax=Dinoroseobacter sp. S124A TaxID=3415128 RepID=UPI003C7BF3DF
MFLKSLVFTGALLAAGAAQAVPLLPGTTLDQLAYFDTGKVVAGDPDFLGTQVASGSVSATEQRDGFSGGGVVDDLYTVTGQINFAVFETSSGHTTFGYDFRSIDDSLAGLLNGARVFSVSGFAGFEVDVGWILDFDPYVPLIERSADGDTITVTYLDPRDTQSDLIETILFKTDADTFDLMGEGEVVIEIDSFGDTTRSLSGLPQPAVIPLPMSGLLLLCALGGLGLSRRRAA